MAYTHSISREAAENKYREVRAYSRSRLEREVFEETGITVNLADITEDALVACEAWRPLYSEQGRELHEPRWSWRKEVRRFKRRARRLELAIWVGGTLCGLALGRISDRCIVATIHLLEGDPGESPLDGKVMPIATRFLELVALDLGCRDASIEAPVPGLVEKYRERGFVKEVTKGKKILRLKKAIVL